jgi:hypothetical protein
VIGYTLGKFYECLWQVLLVVDILLNLFQDV